jgi:hypothetical protein
MITILYCIAFAIACLCIDGSPERGAAVLIGAVIVWAGIQSFRRPDEKRNPRLMLNEKDHPNHHPQRTRGIGI